MKVGYALSSEDHGPRDLVRFAVAAEEAGFGDAWISDHYHPWITRQGNSPFVWSVLGGIAAATNLRMGTGVTCPTMRIHPAIIAQAVATTTLMFDGRFFFGIGTGENLNEHVLGDRWPSAGLRLEMLEEAVEVMRRLWQGGQQTFRGTHYTVENAEIFSLPPQPPPVYMSAFGPKALALAARIADGYVGTAPQADLVQSFDEQSGGGKAKVAGAKCCWGEDQADAEKLAYELWPNLGLPGELAQELETPQHFEQACELVTQEMVAGAIPCGPDPERYVASLTEYADAGYDVVYLHNIGPDQEGFLRFMQRDALPRLS